MDMMNVNFGYLIQNAKDTNNGERRTVFYNPSNIYLEVLIRV